MTHAESPRTASGLLDLPHGSGTTHEETYADTGRVSGTIVALTAPVEG